MTRRQPWERRRRQGPRLWTWVKFWARMAAGRRMHDTPRSWIMCRQVFEDGRTRDFPLETSDE